MNIHHTVRRLAHSLRTLPATRRSPCPAHRRPWASPKPKTQEAGENEAASTKPTNAVNRQPATAQRTKHSLACNWVLCCRWVCMVFMACLVFASPAHAARLALVIGNDSYMQVSALKNARNDARLMASALRAGGFEVSEHFNLDSKRLYEVVDTFEKRIQKGDEVVFFFAGHGVQLDASQMLLPVDIQAAEEKAFKRAALPLLYVQDALKEARVSLLVIDACRDNPFPKQGIRSLGETRGLRPPDVVKGQAVIMSAGRNQKALDTVPGEPNQRNGLFTHEFVRVMRTPGLDVRSALNKVRDEVEDKAAKVNHEQRPSLIDDLRGNFVLLASVKPEPGPAQGGGLNLDELKREDENKKGWAQWQARMKADYEQADGLGDAGLKAKALERFVQAYAQNNPWSEEDEGMRAQASSTLQSLRAQPTQTSRAEQALRDCEQAHCPELVVVPAGSFTMGSNDRDNEKPPRSVNVSSFVLGKYEVTQGQWKAVMGNNPSSFNACGDNCPVERVSWDDAQQYLNKLNQMTGNQFGYRLPSEAEWEYAARAGNTGIWSFGDNRNLLDQYAWYVTNSKFKTQPVGKKQANAFGLHDMHGNVWEWVQDVWHDNYADAGAPTDGSVWTTGGDQSYRVLRGGSWFDFLSTDLRSSSRSKHTRDEMYWTSGFRIARTLP